MQARYDPRQKHDPRRVDAPAIEPLQALDDRFAQLFRGGGVAENAVLDPLLKSREDARWSAKIAVGDPQWNHVAPGVALPARAPGARALERRVEIELHPPVIAKKKPGSKPGLTLLRKAISSASLPPPLHTAERPSSGHPPGGSCCRRHPGSRPSAARRAAAPVAWWRCPERT